MYGSTQYGQTAPSGPALIPNIPAPNVGNYPPDAQNKVDRIYNAYRQSAVNQSYYASQYANRPGANFVAPSLTGMFQQINASVINGNLRPDVDQSKWDTLDYAANFSAGWADTLTFGVTDKFRSTFGFNDGIDHGSATYKAGQIGGMVHSVALGGGGTTSIAIRVPTLRYGLAINGSGALSFAPTMATSITIVGTPQAGMVVAGGFGILHARRMGQNGGTQGSFSIRDWTGYPSGLPKPSGPFRLVDGDEYINARKVANQVNAALRKPDPAKYAGQQIHEIQPVKFGGSPIDLANKIALDPIVHRLYSSWWYRLQNRLGLN